MELIRDNTFLSTLREKNLGIRDFFRTIRKRQKKGLG